MAEEKKPFHQRVADKLIEQLKQGTAPWQKPWETTGSSGLPFNPTTGKRYRGVNVLNAELNKHFPVGSLADSISWS